MIYLQIVLHAYLSFSLPVSSLHFFLSLLAEHFNMAKTFEICDAW